MKLSQNFSFGDLVLECPQAAPELSFSLTRETDAEGAEIAKLSFDSSQELTPPTFTVTFSLPQRGMFYCWSVNSLHPKILPNWGAPFVSEFGSGLPVYVFFDTNNSSSLAIATSEADRRLSTRVGVLEEGSLLLCRMTFFALPEAPLKHYETSIRIDHARRPFCDAVRQSVAWVEKAGGYTPCTPPETAFDPLYSSWYNFHQSVFAKEIEEECAIASSLGMKTIILDDGWQTDDCNRGYAFCGDWQVSPRRFPNMREHVQNVQQMGMKYMVWYSVPFVGEKSANYERFKGKYINHMHGAGVLDPRFPEVRAFLVDTYVRALNDWGLDGFKLDFIDSFQCQNPDPALADNYAGRDMKSVPLAVRRLLCDIRAALTAVKPDILLEFRQSYVGPGVRQCGNMLRVGDCPGDIQQNRVVIANLRLASGATAIHSDMLEWHPDETPENAALFILNSIFGVVQYSIMLRNAPQQHRALIEKWLRFSQEHRETLLKSSFTPLHPELQYPVIIAESASERIIGVYNDGQVIDIPDDKPTILINATGKDSLVIRKQGRLSELACKTADYTIIRNA